MHRCMTQGCSESGATWCGGTLLCFEHAAIVELSCEESLGLGLTFSDEPPMAEWEREFAASSRQLAAPRFRRN